MSKNSKIISFLFIILIVGGGVYWWQQQKATSVVSENETWIDDGFSFTYSNELVARKNWLVPPSNNGLWKKEDVESCKNFDLESIPPGDSPWCVIPYIFINSETTDLLVSEYIANEYSHLTISTEQIHVGETDFTKGTLEDFNGTTMYFAKKGNLMVSFGTLKIHDVSNPPSDDLTEIMSTLKFE